jgi:hypothetical protein
MAVTKKIIINDDSDMKWYEENFPGNSYSWLFSMLLSKFREVCEDGKTPEALALLGAQELKKEIDGV